MTENNYISDKLISKDINEYLKNHENKSLLRFMTCGSVDDGKSTLIGRLLYDSKIIFEDQLNEIKNYSPKIRGQKQEINFSLLVDGLSAEREQAITIDVAYRYFNTKKRKFIVADTPGHEQYTRNMVTAASNSDLAIILIDSRKGILTQTRRHSYICSLLGIQSIVLAINKIDLVNYNKPLFDKIVNDYKVLADSIGIKKFTAIPISGLKGDNVVSRSKKIQWYSGKTLLEYLETVNINTILDKQDPFMMPVQWVNRPNQDFRGFSGRVIAGQAKKGDKIQILPSGQKSTIKNIVTFDGDLDTAVLGQSVTLTLSKEIDCSRGQVITSLTNSPSIADQFEVNLIWMDEEALVPGLPYFLKIGTQTVSATLSRPKYLININNLNHNASNTLNLNDIGAIIVTTDRPIIFTPYDINRDLGGFILINKMRNSTVGVGLIKFSLRRSNNIHWQNLEISREHHSKIKNQKPAILWMTGLSGSGKTTLANLVEKKLAQLNLHTFLLDGDNIRHGLNKDLGFTEIDRIENIRRIGHVAKLMSDAGLIVIAAFISPFKSDRELVRKMTEEGEFIEVFVDTPLHIAEKRDVKGLYAKARSGLIKNFTGIDSPYEPPTAPEIHINTINISIEEATNRIVSYILKYLGKD